MIIFFWQVVALEAGQQNVQLKEQLAAESAKLKEADEVNSRLQEDLKKKNAELEAMKIDMTAANNALSKAIDDILAAEQP